MRIHPDPLFRWQGRYPSRVPFTSSGGMGISPRDGREDRKISRDGKSRRKREPIPTKSICCAGRVERVGIWQVYMMRARVRASIQLANIHMNSVCLASYKPKIYRPYRPVIKLTFLFNKIRETSDNYYRPVRISYLPYRPVTLKTWCFGLFKAPVQHGFKSVECHGTPPVKGPYNHLHSPRAGATPKVCQLNAFKNSVVRVVRVDAWLSQVNGSIIETLLGCGGLAGVAHG